MEIIPGKITAIVGGQFGSEAKGLAASYLANLPDRPANIWCTTNAGAQAGHTTEKEDGTRFVCYHLPTTGVLMGDARIYINAGAIVDVDLLAREIEAVSQAMGVSYESIANRVSVNPNAAVITADCVQTEASSTGTTHIASTGKGVGAALARKIMRQPGATVGTLPREQRLSGMLSKARCRIARYDLPYFMESGRSVIMEVPQGTGLSINNSDAYPHVTSRDCWVGQGLTDAGVHPHYLGNTMMVCRTFPIRVGHVYDDLGGMKGHSGPFAPGSEELNWDEHFQGFRPERTTVTQRVRRIATWSRLQYRRSLALNRPHTVMLTFVNYLNDPVALRDHIDLMRHDEKGLNLKVHHLYSWGPRASQVSPSFQVAAFHTRDFKGLQETV